MSGDRRPTRPEWLALVGALVVTVGTYVPWIVAAPGRDVVISIYVPGMEWGLAGLDYLLLGLLVVGLAAAGRYRRRRRGGSIAAATGGAIVVLTGYVLAGTLLGGPASLGAFVPGLGAALTVAGGLLLVLAGWRHVVSIADGGAAAPATDADASG